MGSVSPEAWDFAVTLLGGDRDVRSRLAWC